MSAHQESPGASHNDSALALARIDAALSDFQYHLQHFEKDLKDQHQLREELFQNAPSWRDLLDHKLLPHLSNRSCLLVVLAGGTSSGKSTLFNLLLQEKISLVKSISATTRVPVLAVNPDRMEAAESNYLLPDFKSLPYSMTGQEEGENYPPGSVFTASSDKLPRSLALLDTPDYDSVEKVNWEVAEKVRAAGDVVLAVITPIKYKDEETIQFFKKARESGRIVIPVFNKVERDQDPEITRQQLRQFVSAAALDDPPCFVVPKDYALEDLPDHTIMDVDGKISLLDYLSQLDVAHTKMKVYRQSLEIFLEQSQGFFQIGDHIKESIDAFVKESRGVARDKGSQLSPTLSPSFEGRLRLQTQETRGPLFIKLALPKEWLRMPLHQLKDFAFKDKVPYMSHQQLVKKEAEELRQCSSDIHKQTQLLSEKYRQWFRRESQKQSVFKLFASSGDEPESTVPAHMVSEEGFASSLFTQTAMEEELKDVWEEHGKVGMILRAIDRIYIISVLLAPIVLLIFGLVKALYFLIPLVIVDWLLLFLRRFCENFLKAEMRQRLEESFTSEKTKFASELYRVIAEPVLKVWEQASAVFETGNYEKLRSCHQECQKNLQNF